MNKIPVGRTIAFAYRFTLGHLGTIIGLVWVPLVVIAVLRFLPYAFGANPEAAPENLTEEGRRALENLGTSLLVILLYAIAYVPVMRQALGLREGQAIVHFGFGPPEFRLFGALLLFVLVLICMALGIGIVGMIFTALAGSAAGKPSAAALMAALIVIAMVCTFLFILIRLGFLLIAVTVAEQHINLGRGWTLTHANFWRCVAVILATSIPIIVINLAILIAMVGPQQVFAPWPLNDARAFDIAIRARLAPLDQHMPLYLGLNLIIAPFAIGLNLGGSAAAYRALTSAAPPAAAS